MDVHDKRTRSYNMSRIQQKNTKPEVLVRKYLFSKGYRYRKNDNRLPGTPDIVLPKYKTVIFINGCFWHGHTGCKFFVWPQTNEQFWKNKIEANIMRDKRIISSLEELGWHIVVLWECQLKPKVRCKTLNELIDLLEIIYGRNN